MARESRIAKTPEEQEKFDKERARRRAYYWANRKKFIGWMRKWQKKHRKSWNKYQKEYYKKNPEKFRIWQENSKMKRETMRDGER